jgi:hypothetical protein
VISEESTLTFQRFKGNIQQSCWVCGLFWSHDPLCDHSAKDECGVEDVLSCYKEILQKDKYNAGWSPKKFAEHKIFMERSDLQAGPSSFQQMRACTRIIQNYCSVYSDR